MFELFLDRTYCILMNTPVIKTLNFSNHSLLANKINSPKNWRKHRGIFIPEMNFKIFDRPPAVADVMGQYVRPGSNITAIVWNITWPTDILTFRNYAIITGASNIKQNYALIPLRSFNDASLLAYAFSRVYFFVKSYHLIADKKLLATMGM